MAADPFTGLKIQAQSNGWTRLCAAPAAVAGLPPLVTSSSPGRRSADVTSTPCSAAGLSAPVAGPSLAAAGAARVPARRGSGVGSSLAASAGR